MAATYLVVLAVTAWGARVDRQLTKQAGEEKRQRAWGSLLMLAAVIGGIAHTLPIGFVSDDFVHLHFVRQYHSGLDAWIPRHDGLAYRPLPMWIWWLLDTAGVGAPGFKFVAWACALGTAWWMREVLVRTGLGSGVASAAMAIWLASPATAEVVAWTSNLYSSLSTLWAAGGLLLIVRARRVGPAILPVLTTWLAAAACKEDIALWPLLGVLIGLSPNSGRGVTIRLAIASLAVTLGFTLAKMHLIESGMSAPSLADHLDASAQGLARTIQSTSILDSLLPMRGFSAAWFPLRIAAQVALVTLWIIRVRQGLARPLGIAAALAILSAIPVARFAPFVIEDSRLCYPISVATAAILAILLPQSGRPSRTGLVACGLFALSAWNIGPWRVASHALETRVVAYRQDLAKLPIGAVVILYGMPDSYAGAYCFRNGGHLAAIMAARRPDISVQGTHYIGRYHEALIYDEKTGRSLRAFEREHQDLWPGAEIGWNQIALRDHTGFRPVDSETHDTPRGLRVSAAGAVPILMAPPLRLQGGSFLRVLIDGEASLDGETTPIPFFLCTSGPDGARREAHAPGMDIPLRPGTTRAGIELACFPRNSLTVRSVRVCLR